MKSITLNKLAVLLNNKVWTKGDLQRIYVDKGFNTKKMTTKVWIEKIEDNFIVKCFIDCPSQPLAWIKSQQQEVISSVEKDIENAFIFEFEKGTEYQVICEIEEKGFGHQVNKTLNQDGSGFFKVRTNE